MTRAGSGPIAFLSTFPPQRCGIGTYTAALASAVAAESGENLVVIAEQGAGSGSDENGILSLPRWTRRGDYGPAVVAAAKEIGARMVHVQHAPDILGMDDRLPLLLATLRASGIATAVTLHTVHSPVSGALERRFAVARFHRRLAETTDAIVVHGETLMRQELLRQGVPEDKVHVIPHGTHVLQMPGQAESRRYLGVPADGPLLLYFGFIHIQKNLHTVLHALERLHGQSADARLLVAGSIQNPAWYNQAYWWYCRRLAASPALAGRAILREGFLPAADIPYVYGAADLVLLPYAQGYGSASGVVHNALGAGKVMLCSRGPKFLEIGENLSDTLLVPAHDADAWARRIGELLTRETERHALMERVAAYANATAWPHMAERHLALYDRLTSAKGASTPLLASTLSRVTM